MCRLKVSRIFRSKNSVWLNFCANFNVYGRNDENTYIFNLDTVENVIDRARLRDFSMKASIFFKNDTTLHNHWSQMTMAVGFYYNIYSDLGFKQTGWSIEYVSFSFECLHFYFFGD